jgi:hypothetical protein
VAGKCGKATSCQPLRFSIEFIDAPGGTGKIFPLNHLLAHVRSQKQIAIAVASSGIAATLLSGGRTAHSTFKLEVKNVYSNNEQSIFNISKKLRACRSSQEVQIHCVRSMYHEPQATCGDP